MGLPILRSVKECGDFSLTVEPFIPELYALPQLVLNNISSPAALKQLYIETNPLVSGLAASIFLGFVFLVVSEFNRNYSQVDRLWSILPNLYNVHMAVWAFLAGVPYSRLVLVALFSTVWSCRLTFNYWRRGGYNIGSEDYRWEIIKKELPGVVWFIFNVTFISFYQSVLLYLFSGVPTYGILLSTQFDPDIKWSDIVYFGIEIGLVISEWFSDGQQWTYQETKHQYYKDAKVPAGFKQLDLDRGFNTSGMWAYSRHPNFFAEQSIWFVLYQWSCYATNTMYNWTGTGAVLLIMLFQGSTWLTEKITTGKYPEYAEYQKQVGMFFPKSVKPFSPPSRQPKIIRTSDLAKRQQPKRKQKQG